MKLSAVAQRGSKKVFFDVFTLCTRHRALELYQEKFSVRDIGLVLCGLGYFDDADEERDPLLLEQVAWERVKQEIRRWVKAIG